MLPAVTPAAGHDHAVKSEKKSAGKKRKSICREPEDEGLDSKRIKIAETFPASPTLETPTLLNNQDLVDVGDEYDVGDEMDEDGKQSDFHDQVKDDVDFSEEFVPEENERFEHFLLSLINFGVLYA